ncbi:tyrosine-type recombinase/integrase [Rhodovulum sp. YEN HP10]|uniref:tyrosine-type recombinase/integrase n=1 Tax=Rhodovulum sp. HP10 TaxID=3387397 RepID=UPI0039E0A47B
MRKAAFSLLRPDVSQPLAGLCRHGRSPVRHSTFHQGPDDSCPLVGPDGPDPQTRGNAMRKWCDEAGLDVCTSHGLRKACARRLAEAGATPHEIAAVTGHKTLALVQLYTEAAGREGLADAAFEKLIARPNGEQNVVNLYEGFAKSVTNPLKGKDKL